MANEIEGKGGNSVTAGLMKMTENMQQGRFKVFSNCVDWFEEFRNYHTENGVIIAKRDDLMSADRYASLSKRHAETSQKVIVKPAEALYAGVSGGWMGA